MACSGCGVRFEAETVCRWDPSPTHHVLYLCAGCCPHCSDKRHSIAPSRSGEVHPWRVLPTPTPKPDVSDEPPAVPALPAVVDLMAALEKSLAEAKSSAVDLSRGK